MENSPGDRGWMKYGSVQTAELSEGHTLKDKSKVRGEF